MAGRTHRQRQIDFKFTGKIAAPMKNNGKTSAIDYGGYRLTFDMILSPIVRSLASYDRHVV
jgi:hypothetical protein